MLELAEEHLRPGDELTWIDGVVYTRMSDGTLMVHFPDRRRRQRPRFYWAAERVRWEEERVAAAMARSREMTESFESGRGKADY